MRVTQTLALGTCLALACRSAGEATDATTGASSSSGSTDASTGDTTGEPALCPAPKDPGPGPLRRLTATQYHNALRDLFPGVTIPPPTIAESPAVHGLENNAEVQAPSALLIEQYQRAALAVTAAAMEAPTFLPCPEGGGDDPTACAHTFLREFGRRAFRRPLRADEEDTYLGFFDQQLAEFGFRVALPLTLQALLQAPPFLYFLEFGDDAGEGEVVALTGHELAARLSFFLWDTIPDDPLLDAAGAGALDTPEGLAAEAARMLADPRARSSFVNFSRQWFDFDRVSTISPDPATYPAYTPELRLALREELDRFVAAQFEGPGTLAALLTAPTTHVTPELGALYGLDVVGDVWTPVTLDPAERAGLLTRAGILAATSHAIHPSPVQRGVLVVARLLCVPPSPPPPGVSTAPPEDDPDQPRTNRERYAQHSARSECAGCHAAIDGVGFGFEHYDALGAYRDQDGGLPVDARGELRGTDIDGPFDGAIDLSHKLAGSAQVHHCTVTQTFRYAFGRDVLADDACTLDELRADFLDHGGDLRALLLSIVRSDAFRTRRR